MSDEHSLDDPLLGDLFAEMRSWGQAPAPAPSDALATLLAADDMAPVAGPLPATQSRRKRMLASKLAALGLAAKAALGVGVAAAAVTTAGITGVLPDAAQHVVATAVEAVTPLQLSDPLAGTNVSSVGNTAGADDDADDEVGGTGQPDNHGACVSAIAKNKTLTGREHGQAVSAVAKSDCGKPASSTSTTIGTTTSSTTSTTIGTANANRGPSGNSGPGNSGNAGNSGNSGNSGNAGGGNGNGNSGNGNGNGGSSGRS